jgi:hypothetical protein
VFVGQVEQCDEAHLRSSNPRQRDAQLCVRFARCVRAGRSYLHREIFEGASVLDARGQLAKESLERDPRLLLLLLRLTRV